MSLFFTTEMASWEGLNFITVKSNALRQRADITVWQPEQSDTNLPLIILLHGVYGSHWAWAIKGQAHHTAQRLISASKISPMVLAMPSDGLYGDGSGYLRHHHADYEQWIVEEVVQVVKEQCVTVTNASPVFIAGLSMGGYGAMRLGAKYPQVFRSFSGLSSLTEFSQMASFVQDYQALAQSVVKEENVLEELIVNATTLPSFRFDCGTDDPLILPNRALHHALLQRQIPHVYEEFTGSHSWQYWQAHLENTLQFFDSLR